MLLGVYVCMVSAYVVFHPKHIVTGISAVNDNAYLQRDNTSSNSYKILHGAFKSVIENKRKTINFLIKTTLLAFVLIFSRFTLPALMRKPGAFLKSLHHP